MNNHPPKILLRFLRWFCHPDLVKYIEGDLIELFEERVREKGVRKARWLFVWDVVKLFRPGIIRHLFPRNDYHLSQIAIHSVKSSIRHLRRNRFFAVVNMTGLVMGMVSCILIMLWVSHESSYDSFHEDADKLYRISCNSGEFHTAVSPGALANALKEDYNFAESVTRLRGSYEAVFQVGNQQFVEAQVFTADANFFTMFSYGLINGDAQTVLDAPSKIVISENTALKFFDQTDVVGKRITMNDEAEFIISGVCRNPPGNSHLDFSVLVPMSYSQSTSNYNFDKSWNEFAFRTYFKLRDELQWNDARTAEVKEELSALYLSREPGFKVDFNIEPIQSIHLENNLQFDTDSGGSKVYVQAMTCIAFLILLIACINYANLSTAQVFTRSKEVMIRKTIGATRSQMVLYFLIEAFIYAFLGLMLALGVIFLVLPHFEEIVEVRLILDLSKSEYLLSFIGLFFLAGLASGIYPAILMSRSTLIKTGQTKKPGWFTMRNTLVWVQFVISISLISANFIVSDQLSLLHNKNLGFDKDNLVYMKLSENLKQTPAFRQELHQSLVPKDFTFISSLPIDMGQANHGLDWEGKDPDLQAVIPNMGVDNRFLSVFEVELTNGRFFSEDLKSDQKHYVINESAAKLMGYTSETVVGKWLDLHGRGNIIGVIRDFHFKSLHMKVEPLILVYYPMANYLVFKTNTDQFQETTAEVEEVVRQFESSMFVDFGFVDQDLARLYNSEQRLGNVFSLFMLVSIVISCLGLVGLTSYTVNTRLKEIGIRKVLGASKLGLARLLSQTYFGLLLMALLMACPITFLTMNQWLNGYAYRINISVFHFGTAICCGLVILVSTISFQLIKATSINPTELLRDE